MAGDGVALTSMSHPDFLLAPSDATWVGKDVKERCWNCAYYSFKVFGGEDNTSGKCFRDHKGPGDKVWYVDGLMSCPAFKSDEEFDRGDLQP